MAETATTLPQAPAPGATAPQRRTAWPGLTFSIRQLLLGTAFVAVSCLALRNASAWWVSTALVLAIASVLIGLLFAIYRRRGERAFWTGFCLGGTAYLAIVVYLWHIGYSEAIAVSHPLRQPGARHLPTGNLSEWAYKWLYERETQAVSQLGAAYGGGGGMYGSSSGYGGESGYDPFMGGGMPGYGSEMAGSGYGNGMPGAASGSAGPMGMISESAVPAAAEPAWKPEERHFINVAHSLWAVALATATGWIALWIYSTGQHKDAAAGEGRRT